MEEEGAAGNLAHFDSPGKPKKRANQIWTNFRLDLEPTMGRMIETPGSTAPPPARARPVPCPPPPPK